MMRTFISIALITVASAAADASRQTAEPLAAQRLKDSSQRSHAAASGRVSRREATSDPRAGAISSSFVEHVERQASSQEILAEEQKRLSSRDDPADPDETLKAFRKLKAGAGKESDKIAQDQLNYRDGDKSDAVDGVVRVKSDYAAKHEQEQHEISEDESTVEKMVAYRYGPFLVGLRKHFNDVWMKKKPKWWPQLWSGWRLLDQWVAYGILFLIGITFFTCFYFTGLLPAAYLGYFGCWIILPWSCFKAIQVGCGCEKFYWSSERFHST